jgi:hypothetical protein
MAPRAHERRSPPGARDLEETLGRTSPLWARVQAELSSEFGPLDGKWSFSAKTQRWSLQLKHPKKKRTVLYLIVCPGHFLAGFALGEKACAAARSSGLPPPVLEAIEAAPRYAEGRGLWLEVRTRKDVASVTKLATIKMAH